MSEKRLSARDVVALLKLAPHPEGGHFRETYRQVPKDGGRGDLTLIYFLLTAGERSAWHRIDAVETWHWYAGAPLRLGIAEEEGVPGWLRLGNDLADGLVPQAVVPARAWQAAESEGEWSLVGCAVAPAFRFEGFEMAPKGWEPGKA